MLLRRLDAGPVAHVERVQILPLDTAVAIEAKLATACVPLVRRTLPALSNGTLVFRDQDEASASFCRRLAKDDGVLDFSAPASVLAARTNGLFPWPACTIELNRQLVRIGQADVAPENLVNTGAHSSSPGEILGTDREGLRVATGSGVLRLRRLQRPGGRMLEATEFFRGFPVQVGTRLASRPMAELVSTVPFKK